MAALDPRLPDGSGIDVCRDVRIVDARSALLTRLRDGAPNDERLASLTDRKRAVLGLITEGMTNRRIGARLVLAEKAVRNRVGGLLAKLGMERRTQAAVFGAESRPAAESRQT